MTPYPLIIALILINSIQGCKTPGAELAERSSNLVEAGLLILETHKDEPEKAPAAFKAFMKAEESEIQALSEIATSIAKDKGEQAAARRVFLQELKTLQPRLDDVARAYKTQKKLIEEFSQIADKALKVKP